MSDPRGGGPYTGGGTSQARQRYLKGQCPDSVLVGKPFSLLVSIVLAGPARAGLKPFDVPPEGRDVLLVAYAPGLRLLGDQRLAVHVPADGDSEPVVSTGDGSELAGGDGGSVGGGSVTTAEGSVDGDSAGVGVGRGVALVPGRT